MPTNYTEHYNLNQWEPGDKVLRADFNADNTKIDAALKAVAVQVDELSADKAGQSALDALSKTVSAQTAALAKLGNCQLYTAAYTGDGSSSRSAVFPHRPVMVFVYGDANTFSAMYGVSGGHCRTGGEGVTAVVTWSGNSVRWEFNRGAHYICNESGEKYRLVALLDMEN